jgi:hypothetical protein
MDSQSAISFEAPHHGGIRYAIKRAVGNVVEGMYDRIAAYGTSRSAMIIDSTNMDI